MRVRVFLIRQFLLVLDDKRDKIPTYQLHFPFRPADCQPYIHPSPSFGTVSFSGSVPVTRCRDITVPLPKAFSY